MKVSHNPDDFTVPHNPRREGVETLQTCDGAVPMIRPGTFLWIRDPQIIPRRRSAGGLPPLRKNLDLATLLDNQTPIHFFRHLPTERSRFPHAPVANDTATAAHQPEGQGAAHTMYHIRRTALLLRSIRWLRRPERRRKGAKRRHAEQVNFMQRSISFGTDG